MTSFYRTIHEEEKRGPLTLREKAAAAFSGLRTFEPLLSIASRALDESLPRAERLKAVKKLAASSNTDRINAHLIEEKDLSVKEALAYAFAEAYYRRRGEFDMALCNRYSAMGAQSAIEEKDEFVRNARSQARAALEGDLTLGARSVLESVALGRPQI